MNFFVDFLGHQTETNSVVEEVLPPVEDYYSRLDFSNTSSLTLTGNNIDAITDLGSVGGSWTLTSSNRFTINTATINGVQCAQSSTNTVRHYTKTISAYTGTTLSLYGVLLAGAFTADRRFYALTQSGVDDLTGVNRAMGLGCVSTTNFGATRNSVDIGMAASVSTVYYFSVHWDGTNCTPYRNGVAGTPVASSGAFNISYLRIGNRANAPGTSTQGNGRYGEFLLYLRNHDANEITDTHEYLATKWGF